MRTMIERNGGNLSGIIDALGIKKRFNQADLVFIEEYCIVMSPISTALTILEGQKRIILASLTIPQFKTAWIEDEGGLNNDVSILKEEIKVLAQGEFDNKQSSNDSEKSSEDGPFSSVNYHHEPNADAIGEYLSSRQKNN
ncbi:hypothetical protein LOD99_9130 [Oopsacas minuta]|uniref:Uncharacterized protein n=1 Tax=Oopsacas minuta TaxID=111878 RepID=A0AAV7JDQ1_9METZ|nr:hypothetical protein LOD99_9130 [Oopsacas minuta]